MVTKANVAETLKTFFFIFRCSQYDQNPNCVLIPDPSDPECCKKPQCTSQNTNPPVIVGTNPPRPPVYLTFGPGQTINGGTRPTVPAPGMYSN